MWLPCKLFFANFFCHRKDPGILFETKDIEQFLARIAQLIAIGGGDGPEPSIGAVIRAIEACEPGSPIYLYTDAPASDAYRLNEARSLASGKNVRIFPALVNRLTRKRSLDDKQMYDNISRTKRQVGNDVYELLALYSGGQVLNVRTSDISNLASLVSFSAVQSRRTIFRRSSVLYGTVEHSIPVDSSVVEVLISINGRSIGTSVSSPQGWLHFFCMIDCYLLGFIYNRSRCK